MLDFKCIRAWLNSLVCSLFSENATEDDSECEHDADGHFDHGDVNVRLNHLKDTLRPEEAAPVAWNFEKGEQVFLSVWVFV